MPKQTITTEIDCPEGYEFVRIGKYAGHGEYQRLADGSMRDNLMGQLDRPIFRMLEPPKPVRREFWLYRNCPYEWPHKNAYGEMRPDQIHVREVLEGDPTPAMIDDLLAAIDRPKPSQVTEATVCRIEKWILGVKTERAKLAAKLRGKSDE